jgi:hypothetical protein
MEVTHPIVPIEESRKSLSEYVEVVCLSKEIESDISEALSIWSVGLVFQG